MSAALRILHLEDDGRDAELVQGVLEAGGVACEVARVDTREAFVAALERDAFDVILADFSLPSFDGLSALNIAREKRPELPFIFVSGTLGEEIAIDAVKIGATDYVLKERLSRIVSSVRRALRETRERTERRHAEEQLRRSEAFLAEGQRISHTGSWGWILSSGKVTWSEHQYRMLGFEPCSVEPSLELFLSALHPEDRSRVREELEDATRAYRAYEIRYRVILPDGAVRNMCSVGRPVADAAGAIDEYIGVTTDVTERVQAEQSLRQAQRLEAMGKLAGGVAHDFNNILGAILGYGEMAMRDAAPGSRLRRDLDSIVSAGERGRSLVDRILAFSRSGVGERVPVHVEEVVCEALDQLAAKLPENVTIAPHLSAGRAAMLGDSTQVHQVVMNLCNNAVQAMPQGGMLRVALDVARIESARPAAIGSVAPGDYLVLRVADSGTGIAPDVLEQMFDPFFTTKDVGVGTGLGLSLVHSIVANVGGAIEVATELGKGTAFTVYLPRNGYAPAKRAEESRPLPRGDGERVLIVDDEEPLVRLATETLEGLGYAPVGFTSSVNALQEFGANPEAFDAILTDERMPGVTGSTIIREVRRISHSIPILLMTGYVGAAAALKARELGADEVLKKPLLARDLATSLARVLQR